MLALWLAGRTGPPPPPEPAAMSVTLLTLPPVRSPEPASGQVGRGSPPSSIAPPAARQEAAAGPDPSAPGRWQVRPEAPDEDGARRALRAQAGCAARDRLALTVAERDACDEAMARASETARTYAVVSPKLQKRFDGVFECPKNDVWCEYRIGKAPYPGLFAPRKRKDPSWD